MSKPTCRPIVLAVLALAACGLCACGSSDPSGKVIATVGKSEITQAQLSHWMATDVAGDYRELNGSNAPKGLVSDPPDYPRCVAAAKSIVTSSGAPTKLSDAQVRLKCHQLHTVASEQALSFLISALWSIEEGAEHGQRVSEAELTRALNKLRHEEYPDPAQFKRYLTQEGRSVSDERYLLQRNILNETFVNRLKAQAGKGPASEKAFTTLVLANEAKWIAKTHCKAGYRSIQCKQYAGSTSASPSAAVLVEHLKAGT
jgi:hypothetical protein